MTLVSPCSELTPGPHKLQKRHCLCLVSPDRAWRSLAHGAASARKAEVLQTPSCPRWLSRGSYLWFVWLSHTLAAKLSGMHSPSPKWGEGAVEEPVSLSSAVVSTAARTGFSLIVGQGVGQGHTAPLPWRGLPSFWRHRKGPQGCIPTPAQRLHLWPQLDPQADAQACPSKACHSPHRSSAM